MKLSRDDLLALVERMCAADGSEDEVHEMLQQLKATMPLDSWTEFNKKWTEFHKKERDLEIKVPDFIPPDVILELRKDGTFLDGKKVDAAALPKMFKDSVAAGKQSLKVVVDKSTGIRRVMQVLDTAGKAGLHQTTLDEAKR